MASLCLLTMARSMMPMPRETMNTETQSPSDTVLASSIIQDPTSLSTDSIWLIFCIKKSFRKTSESIYVFAGLKCKRK